MKKNTVRQLPDRGARLPYCDNSTDPKVGMVIARSASCRIANPR